MTTTATRNGHQQRVVVNLGTMFDRPPPHDETAEMALLGALIIDPPRIGEVIERLPSGAAFYREANGTIYDALVRLHAAGKPGDLTMLRGLLADQRTLEDVGGERYIVDLARGVSGAGSASYYAERVFRRWRMRQLAEAAGTIAHEAYHATDEDADEVLDSAEQRVFDLAQRTRAEAAADLGADLEAEWARLQQGQSVTGVRTHLHDLDELTGGLQPGDMIVVAARPSMGKSALALCLAEQAAAGGPPWRHATGEGAPVGLFSLEMSRQSIAQRFMAMRAGVDLHKLRAGRCDADEMLALSEACEQLQRVPIYIDDTASLTVMGLRSRARRMVQRHGVRMLVIDYLQLMTAPGKDRDGRQVEVSAISRGIKALARELSIPVVCLSQLNRGPEARAENRPRMSDLRESGAIEQDADVVMLLHREEYYHIGDEDWKAANQDKIGAAELIVAKQRNGPTDTVPLVWDARTTRFKDRAAGVRR